jgi:Zn-dependent protease
MLPSYIAQIRLSIKIFQGNFMEKDYWRLGSWRGIAISMHWTVLISIAWLYLLLWNLFATAIASVAFVTLLLVHEFGHVYILRKRGIVIETIQLFGIHGKTSHEWASTTTEMIAAWGGVGAQMLVLLSALVIGYALDAFGSTAIVGIFSGPILFVWTKLNIFLMIIALIPIGPFDGNHAWKIVPWTRNNIRKRRQVAREKKMFPEKYLSPEKRRHLEGSSAKAAEELITRFTKKTEDRSEDV